MRWLAIVALPLSGCSGVIHTATKQERLDELATSCGLPKDTLHLENSGSVLMHLSPDAKFESVDCALQKIKTTEFANKLGFVGNEAYRPEKK
jgi:hypothetical protein